MVTGVQQLLIVLAISGLQQLSRMMLHRRPCGTDQRVARYRGSASSWSGGVAAAGERVHRFVRGAYIAQINSCITYG